MGLDTGDKYIDRYGVQIDQQYNGTVESDNSGRAFTVQHFNIRQWNVNQTRRVEMPWNRAYHSLLLFLANKRPTIQANLTGRFETLTCSRIRVVREQADGLVYRGEVEWSYDPRRVQFGLIPLWSHQQTPRTITQVYPAMPQRYYRADDKPDIPFSGVNWNGEKMEYEGVETDVPQWTSTCRQSVGASRVTLDWIAWANSIQGKANFFPFQGFAGGCVRFMGIDMQQNGTLASYMGHYDPESAVPESLYWDITYKFIMEPWLANFEVAEIPVAYKEGHEYLWVSSRKIMITNDEGKQEIRLIPDQVNIAQMYGYADFAFLGIFDPNRP